MQTFIDTVTGQPWQFEAHDDVRLVGGVWQVFDINGKRILAVPETLVPGELPTPAEPTLDDLKEAKVVELSAACRAEILEGFYSTALGQAHLYPTKETDQLNLASSVLDSLLPGLPEDWQTPFWCADEDGLWSFRLHTTEQIQQVGRDAKTSVLHCMTKNATLAAQVMKAETAEGVAAISWDMPEPPIEEPEE